MVVGGINTVLGYAITVGMYYLLHPALSLLAIAAMANVICITISFSMYKCFIFKTNGHWLPEYLRSYVVYGGSALFNMAGLWVLAELAGMPVWLAQCLVMGVAFIASFVGHELFTFKCSPSPTA